MSAARSNDPRAGTGADIYKRNVLANAIVLEPIAAHYAISSIFSNYGDETEIFCYRIRRLAHDITASGRGKLALGRAEVESRITERKETFLYAVLHFGDQNITAAVKPWRDEDAPAFAEFSARVTESVKQANFPEVIRELDRFFGKVDYSLTSLFVDEQQRIIELILNTTLDSIERSLTAIYDEHASLMHYLAKAGLPRPPALLLAAGFALNAGLREALESESVDPAVLRSYLSLAEADGIQLDASSLGYLAAQRMKQAMQLLQLSLGSFESLDHALHLAEALAILPFVQHLWDAQNIWYEIYRGMNRTVAGLNAEDKPRWDEGFSELAGRLSIDAAAIRLEDLTAETTGD